MDYKMKVTDKNLYIEPKLKSKLDLMATRTLGKSEQDNVVLIDGDEGSGKTNIASLVAYYMAYVTKRELSINNVFFDLDKLIDFAMKTEKQIIWWDEGALGGLASEWWMKNQKRFMKLLMISRKRRHFFIICIPKFFKLNEYFVVDRSIALLHTYADKGINIGRFVYFTKAKKEYLFYDWKKSRRRSYKNYYDFRGRFTKTLGKVINEKLYDKKKDSAILNMDGEEEKKSVESIQKEFRQKIVKNLMGNGTTQKQMAEMFNVSIPTIQRDFKDLRQIEKTSPSTHPY